MPKIENWNRARVKVFRPTLEQALATLAEEYGVDITVGNAKFDSNFAQYQVRVTVTDDEGRADTPEYADLKRYHPDLVDKEIRGGQFTIVGFRVRAPRRPWLIKRISDGKIYVSRSAI